VTFDAVQAHVKASNPKVTHPQVVGGPTLLTGLIQCANGMTVRRSMCNACCGR
jgi:hypothetical protein